MEPVVSWRQFHLFRALPEVHLWPGYHLWTGSGHRQVWPLNRFWRRSDS